VEIITAPIFLLTSRSSCWMCGEEQEVVGLVAQTYEWVESAHEGGRFQGHLALLSNISYMPDELLSYIREHLPRYSLSYSKIAGHSIYTNTCECGAHFGDFLLYSDPGGAFWPLNEEEAARITYRQLPMQGELSIDCACSTGLVDFMLGHGIKVTS
jgi:hypothetical protein